MKHDQRHGGPYDRGSADAYYRRDFTPHYYTGDTGSSTRVKIKESDPEYAAYLAGWNEQHAAGEYKDWG